MKARAYAKINLALKLKGKRPDGYHELQMLMININLYDTLIFKNSDAIKVETDKNVCKQEDNIVYKVAMLIKNRYSVDKGCYIYIKKRIPDGGGLGGGSSDAATTILALNKLWNLNLAFNEMCDIANAVGSDVCFFLYNKISLIEGRGDIVKPIDKTFNKKVILIIPPIKCSTKEVYSKSDEINSSFDINDSIKNLENKYSEYLFNDLELAAKTAYPNYQLDNIKDSLYSLGVEFTMMSGSGSTIFAIYKNESTYKQIKKAHKNMTVVKAKTISCCKTL